MGKWIEVKARYDKMQDNGLVKRVTEPYLVNALSCTEAEARANEELRPFISGEFNISSVTTTKISEIFWDATGDKFYKVKVNFLYLDDKTGAERRTASYILVQASSFKDAYDNFIEEMKGTMADFEIEGINETKYVDVYKAELTPKQEAERMLRDPEVKKHVKKFVDACADGGVEKVTMTATDGRTVHSATLEIRKKDNLPKSNDNG